MDKIKQSCRGFTVIELMVGILSFSVMVLVVGSMLVFGWQGWARYNQNVAMQRDATLGLTIVSKEIRNASYGDIMDGAGISFSKSGISFGESGKNIVRNDGTKVVVGWLRPGTFITRKQQATDTTGQIKRWVEVGFTLETTTDSEAYRIKVSPRNES